MAKVSAIRFAGNTETQSKSPKDYKILDSMYKSLHEEFDYITDTVSEQPHTAWITLLYAANALLTMARIVEKEFRIN